MADAKVEIEDLPPTTTQARSDLVPTQKVGGTSVKQTIAQILGLINGSDIANAASTGASDDTFDDTDKMLYLTGTTLKLGTLSGLIASIFKTNRTIANAQFDAATFKLFNTAGPPRALRFIVTALTADRTITLPDASVDLTRVNNMLGYDQTWQDVAASRAGGVVYQNTSGGPIEVNIKAASTSARNIDVSPNGTTWITLGTNTNSGTPQTFNFTVPPGWYYRVDGALTAGYTWVEMRK